MFTHKIFNKIDQNLLVITQYDTKLICDLLDIVAWLDLYVHIQNLEFAFKTSARLTEDYWR